MCRSWMILLAGLLPWAAALAQTGDRSPAAPAEQIASPTLTRFDPDAAALAAEAPAEAQPPPQAQALPEATRPYALTLYWENDGQLFKWNNPTDRYYTNGVGLSVAFTADWVEALARHMPFAEQFGPAQTAAGLVMAQQIFTPQDINSPATPPDDRPYVGHLWGGAFWQRQGEAGHGVATLDHFQLDLGIVGPSSLAEDAQTWIHERFEIDVPRGWDDQLRDEPTLQLTLRKKWRADLLGAGSTTTLQAPDEGFLLGPGTVGVQLLPELGATLGNAYRWVEGGATLRVGWNLPDDFGPGRLTNVASATGRGARRGLSLYGFVRLTGRAVEHDLTVEGNTWRDGVERQAEPLVGEFEWGAVLAYAWRSWSVAAGYSQTFQTRTFDTQQGSDAWGAYTLTITGWF